MGPGAVSVASVAGAQEMTGLQIELSYHNMDIWERICFLNYGKLKEMRVMKDKAPLETRGEAQKELLELWKRPPSFTCYMCLLV